MDPTDLMNYAAAIRKASKALATTGLAARASTRNGDRAYGAYQVMGNNIPSWTQKHYGQSLNPQQFLQNKEAQDAVFNGEFGGYVQKHGNPQDAASMWFTGRPLAQGGNSDDGFITGNQYVDRFNKALGQGGGSAVLAAINAGSRGTPAAPGALGYAATGQEGGGALSQAKPQDPASGGVLFQGNEKPNKLYGVGSMLTNMGASLAGINSPSQANALHAQAKGLEEQMSSGKYTYQMGPNGQLIRINKEDGTVDSRAIPDGQKNDVQVVMGKDENGNPTPLGYINKNDPSKFNRYGAEAGAQPAQRIGGDPELTGQERYDSLSTQEKKQIDAWKAGTGIQPSQYAMRDQRTKKMVDAANSIGIDMTKYGERQAFLKGMASKGPTQAGGQFISAPTVMDHLLNVANDYVTLGNSSGGGYSTGAAVANYVKDLRGGTERESQQTSADRNSDTASKEIVSFLTRGHGGVSERQDTHDKLYMPRKAPEVQAAALEAYRKQVADRFWELADGAKGSVGEDHPEVNKAIEAFKAKDEALQAKIAQLKGNKAPAAAATAPAAKPAAIPSSWDDAQKAGWK
jgi:hypothetical protein